MLDFHPQQFKMFKEARGNNELAHAYLFTGAEGVGKLGFAREIAKFLQDTEQDEHPDIIETPSPLPIEEAQELKKRLRTSPFSGKYKIVILPRAENMHADAANSLLKMIEEPRGDTIFILCSAYPALVLETIRSRCMEIKFNFVPDNTIEKNIDTSGIADIKVHWEGRPAFAKELSGGGDHRKKTDSYRKDYEKFIKGSLTERFNISEKYAKIEDKREAASALRVWMECAREDGADGKILSGLLNIYQNMMTTNANLRYALEGLAVKTYAK